MNSVDVCRLRFFSGAASPGSSGRGRAGSGPVPAPLSHRWNGNPRPQPQPFSKLVFLISFNSKSTLHLSKPVIWVVFGVGVPISLVIEDIRVGHAETHLELADLALQPAFSRALTGPANGRSAATRRCGQGLF